MSLKTAGEKCFVIAWFDNEYDGGRREATEMEDVKADVVLRGICPKTPLSILSHLLTASSLSCRPVDTTGNGQKCAPTLNSTCSTFHINTSVGLEERY